MPRVFVTGSTTGLGLAAAESLLDDGHEVIVHARNQKRAAALNDLAGREAHVVLGDLTSRDERQHVADQVDAIDNVDAG